MNENEKNALFKDIEKSLDCLIGKSFIPPRPATKGSKYATISKLGLRKANAVKKLEGQYYTNEFWEASKQRLSAPISLTSDSNLVTKAINLSECNYSLFRKSYTAYVWLFTIFNTRWKSTICREGYTLFTGGSESCQGYH